MPEASIRVIFSSRVLIRVTDLPGRDHFQRVRIEGNHHGNAADLCCHLFQLAEDLTVTEMNAVKIADGDHRIAQRCGYLVK